MCAQSLTTEITQISYLPIYTDDHAAVKWCRWGNHGLVPNSNQWLSGEQFSELCIPQCIFKINQLESRLSKFQKINEREKHYLLRL